MSDIPGMPTDIEKNIVDENIAPNSDNYKILSYIVDLYIECKRERIEGRKSFLKSSELKEKAVKHFVEMVSFGHVLSEHDGKVLSKIA